VTATTRRFAGTSPGQGARRGSEARPASKVLPVRKESPVRKGLPGLLGLLANSPAVHESPNPRLVTGRRQPLP